MCRAVYRPRDAEHTVLHQVVSEHLEAFLRAAAEAGDGVGLPKFVERELLEFLACGVFERLARSTHDADRHILGVDRRGGLRPRGSQGADGNSEGASAGEQAPVVTGQLEALTVISEEVHRGEMERIERPDRRRERLERAGEDEGGEFHDAHSIQKLSDLVAVGAAEPAHVNPVPHLVLE